MTRQLLKLATSSLTLKAVRVAATILITSILARSLTQSDFGVYSYTIAIAGLAAIPAMMGLPTFVVREAASLRASGERHRIRHLLLSSIARSFTFAGAATLIYIVLANILGPSDGKLDHLLVALLLLPAASSLLQTSSAITRGGGYPVLGQIPDSIVFPVALLALVSLLKWTPALPANALTAISLHIGAVLLAALLSIGIAYRSTSTTEHSNPAMVQTYRFPDGTVSTLIYLGLYEGISNLFQNTDMLLLGLLRSEEEVGIYRISMQFISLMILGVGVVNTITLPMFAEHAKRGDHEGLRTVYQSNRLISFAIAALALLGIVAFARPVTVLLFGQQYLGAVVPLYILCVGQLLNTAIGPVAAILTMDGLEREVFKAMLAALLLNVALNAVLIPYFGLLGAASATSVCLVASKLHLIYTTRRQRNLVDFALPFRARSIR